ncbi:MAG TPA: C4-dicarboxylate ABC transporter permease, partial [Alcanivorax sp.]|nr:C4-dicarboxylate ABC transporter permease [Alcanivorax sp.]
MLIVLALIMLVLLLLGYPMMVPLAVGTLFMMFTGMTFFGPDQAVTWMVTGVGSWVLAAVPMFIFAADILTKGHTANRLLDLVDAFSRHWRGGLPITTAAACAMFGAVSGSTQATVVAMGGPMRPRLLAKGYPDSFALALIINASDVALLIPPSIGFIVYGVVMKTSIGDLFLAGILPGLLMSALFIAAIWLVTLLRPEAGPRGTPQPLAERLRLFARAAPLIAVIVVSIGGIYLGVFTPVEASGIGAGLVIVIALVTGGLSRAGFVKAMRETVRTSAMLYMIVIGANVLNPFLAITDIPLALSEMLTHLGLGPYGTLPAILLSYVV